MARLARIVVPGLPHHVTQRGNRRQPVFFSPEDFQAYKDLLREWCENCGVAVWAYCLMTNHVHLILVPNDERGLRTAVGETHRRYTRRINFREGWRGHLWQERFASFVMDERHLLAAARYIELNPLRAKIETTPGTYPWSSDKAHLAAQDDGLVKVQPLLALVPDWGTFLASGLTEEEVNRIEQHHRTGRPLGSEAFVEGVGDRLGRCLLRRKPGPKPLASCRS